MKEWLELRAGWLSSNDRPAYRAASDAEISCNANSPFAQACQQSNRQDIVAYLC
jgi:hypothetical protein